METWKYNESRSIGFWVKVRTLKRSVGGREIGLTCPPAKPTATTPSSGPLARNLGVIVGGEVIVMRAERSGLVKKEKLSMVNKQSIRSQRSQNEA